MTEIDTLVGSLQPLTLDISAIREMADDAGTTLVRVELPETIHGLPSQIPVLIDRNGGKAISVKPLLEEYREKPRAKLGTAEVKTLESFISLVNRHKTSDSVIFAETDWQKPSITAVIDYHQAESGGEADNCKHRIKYPFPLSEEWQAWVAQNGQPMNQTDFAQWIEDHIPDLAAPTQEEVDEYLDVFSLKTAYPNELVTLSRGLQVNVASNVKNNVTLQSGEGQITFEEEHRDATGAKLSVPGLFILSIAPFFMGTKARIPVRLRYRVKNGAVIWSFHLYRPDIHITDQVRADLDSAEQETALPAYEGKPEVTV
ncbi:DUF2303 family protein [Agrobacterium vitis]|uniref:DUF2303 family protein n=1 Tax=Agrobacterium vitis TaxID=373 RepID=UPI001571671A|nr:DUF2303 family protein [Agrobacterium vitis]NSZ47954.1 DUF2303 family protein [Agrobacterium vitis]UJL72888.1 DUF2303 family protein [Agrobacterium vitis]